MKIPVAMASLLLSLSAGLYAESEPKKEMEKPSPHTSMDQDKDGKVTYEEFYGHKLTAQKEALKKKKEQLEFEEQNLATKEEVMMKKFKRMDLDGDGVLQERELKAFLPRR